MTHHHIIQPKGLPDSVDGNPDMTLFPGVSTETTYGVKNKVRMRLPVFTGALGSNEIAGGFSSEDQIFKVLAMGAPYTKAVCMGRALMIPGMVGKNIGQWIKEGGDALPKTVSAFGTTVEEIFVCYEDLIAEFGRDTVKGMPLDAIGLYTFADKLKVGLQQLMAGSRNFSIPAINRKDLTALTPEAAQVSGIPCVMDAYRQEAEEIING
jgi:hypothetical protein